MQRKRSITSFLINHRLWIICIWVIILVTLISLIPKFLGNLVGATFKVYGSPTETTQQLLDQRFPSLPSEQGLVVLHSDTLTIKDTEFKSLIAQTKTALQNKPHVKNIISPYDPAGQQQIAEGGHTSFLLINLEGSDDQLQKNVPELSSALPKPPKDIQLYLTGQSSLNADSIKQENLDIENADKIGLPIAFLVLMVAFGSAIAAGLPLLLGGVGIAGTFGLLAVINKIMNFDSFVESAVVMVGLALGIDYCLMIVTRFREELAANQDKKEAVIQTMRTAGRAVLFSGITVIISLSGLLIVQAPLFRGLAVGMMLTVSTMLILCLTLLPIILYSLGKRINSLSIPMLHGKKASGDSMSDFWARWAHSVMRHPIWAILLTSAALLALAWPVLNMKLGFNLGMDTLQDQPSVQGLKIIEKDFSPGLISPIQVIVSKNSGQFNDEDLQKIDYIAQAASADKRVKAVKSPAQTLDAIAGKHNLIQLQHLSQKTDLLDNQINTKNGLNLAIISVIPKDAADDQRTSQLLGDLKSKNTQIIPDSSNLSVGYLGTTARITDMNAEINRSLPLVLIFVLSLSFVLLAFNFRSLFLPLKAIAMNLLALSASFGLIVVVFQNGFGQWLFGFTSPGYIQNFLPLLTFVILFGLSMDYEVFLLSRIQEEWRKTGDNAAAVATGLAHTAKVITHAAAIMIAVFVSFIIAHMLEVKQLGFALAIAVLIDATLIRLLLVPAAMRLMGRWNWWLPKWLGGKD